MTRMKQASVLLATALAHSVFPVPGGPYSSTPFGGSAHQAGMNSNSEAIFEMVVFYTDFVRRFFLRVEAGTSIYSI